VSGLDVLEVLVQYGYLLLFIFVLAEQAGLPIPAVPALLGVGALAASGRMSLILAFGAVLAASLPVDLAWYELGRRRGRDVLGGLCRIALEPDYCVRRAENLFVRAGQRALLVTKFFPGLSAIASPLAGLIGVRRVTFIALDGLGALLWSGTWMGLGYLFKDALELLAAQVARLGHYVLLAAAGVLAVYIAVKFTQRQRIFRSLRMARITADELKRRLDAGDADLVVVDTRSAVDVSTTPYSVRGAIWIAAEEIDERQHELPRDREIILYCT
jgi:membrane protein DedA with SNARE-associated domain